MLKDELTPKDHKMVLEDDNMNISIKAEYAEHKEEVLQEGVRNDWSKKEIEELFNMPFMDLLYKAQSIHKELNIPNKVQLSTLVNIKSGNCSEDCKYCSQSSRYNTDVEKSKLIDVEVIKKMALRAKEAGANRLCMGAAWRTPNKSSLEKLGNIVKEIKALGMETCMTLGMLDSNQAQYLKDKGLDYYNHNIDTSQEYYKEVVTTRTYEDRLKTIENVRDAGINVCSGGIIGMGESRVDRVGFLYTLATMNRHPQSVPINMLVPMSGTPFENQEKLDTFEWVRTVAVARILMPKSYVRLSAGRGEISDEAQALCFLAGANSIFYGDRLLTSKNPQANKDLELLNRLDLEAI